MNYGAELPGVSHREAKSRRPTSGSPIRKLALFVPHTPIYFHELIYSSYFSLSIYFSVSSLTKIGYITFNLRALRTIWAPHLRNRRGGGLGLQDQVTCQRVSRRQKGQRAKSQRVRRVKRVKRISMRVKRLGSKTSRSNRSKPQRVKRVNSIRRPITLRSCW